jgi:hypothetical protein
VTGLSYATAFRVFPSPNLSPVPVRRHPRVAFRQPIRTVGEVAAPVSRNDPCPCGSGEKYKRCCGGRDAAKPRRSGFLTLALLVLLVAGGATAVVIGLSRGWGGSAGRVWSAEHGHWHDAPGGRSSSGTPVGAQGLPAAPAPAPPGTPPPGKVWSAEHGHWHDAPPGSQLPAPAGPAVPPPPGPPPPGKVWSAEHGHWHDAARGASPAVPPSN